MMLLQQQQAASSSSKQQQQAATTSARGNYDDDDASAETLRPLIPSNLNNRQFVLVTDSKLTMFNIAVAVYLLALSAPCLCDIYMQNPRGSNNRCCTLIFSYLPYLNRCQAE
jgi:hypothetical protein